MTDSATMRNSIDDVINVAFQQVLEESCLSLEHRVEFQGYLAEMIKTTKARWISISRWFNLNSRQDWRHVKFYAGEKNAFELRMIKKAAHARMQKHFNNTICLMGVYIHKSYQEDDIGESIEVDDAISTLTDDDTIDFPIVLFFTKNLAQEDTNSD